MNASGVTSALIWPGRLLAEDDLRRHWTSQGEIVLSAKTIVTPLALDFLKGKRVAIRREGKVDEGGTASVWGIVEETPSPLIAAAVKALMQEGRMLSVLTFGPGDLVVRVRAIATRVLQGDPPGVVVLSEQPGLAACVGNKISGVRAVSMTEAKEVANVKALLSPNMFVVATTDRTFFEFRQLLKALTALPPNCPEPMAKTLRELDGHAHR